MNIIDSKLYLKVAFGTKSLQTSFRAALVVGLLLNLINNGDHLLYLRFEQINWIKFGLNFLVPFLVASYAGLAVRFQFLPGTLAFVDCDLICRKCKKEVISVQQNQLVPTCSHCGPNTRWRYKGLNPNLKINQ